MNRNDLFLLPLSLIAGFFVGLNFRALWWTVTKASRARRPASLFIGSFIARTFFALLVFYFVGRNHPAQLAICLPGFILARMLMLRVGESSAVGNETLARGMHAP